ncbi:hypothetical protein GTY80_15430 [Amycolatopsis sp. SID8362]|nr:hypothetical protein [Amycolatopsis sp. SID8362]NBH04632.1 hypothetical protein [Amycolatopsis sp. SID8362]NED40228.1 transposase [Amycolatopsis sp. SID8362]NED41332.1 transposase [Amycolatopsis sp. SID8362]
MARDDLRSHVLDNLGDPGATVAADEAGFRRREANPPLRSGSSAVTAGRIENCRLGVFLTRVSVNGLALIDRELYLPASWTGDRERRAEAGYDFEWFTANEAYDDNSSLRDWGELTGLN